MKILKVVLIFFVPIFCLPLFSNGQCGIKIQSHYRQISDNDYSLLLEPEITLHNVEIQLYDLNAGKIVKEVKLNILATTNNEVFIHVTPSVYIFYIKSDECPKVRGLGGVEGIQIGSKQKKLN